MSAKPAVILIGADKGGVGKTTVARTLLDYLAARGLAARAFDSEAPNGTLKRFFSAADVVDITAAADQMRVFDTLYEATVTVIDIRAGLLSATLATMRDIGCLDAARKGVFSLAVFHVLGPSIASLEEIAGVAGHLDGSGAHVLTRNFINKSTYFNWDPATYNAYFRKVENGHAVVVPHLEELACEKVELAAVPFAAFVADKAADGASGKHSFVLRGYVRAWLDQVFAQYDRVKLIELMA